MKRREAQARSRVLALVARRRDRRRVGSRRPRRPGSPSRPRSRSRLHKRLVTLGFTGGLFEPLTIPPADAPALIAGSPPAVAERTARCPTRAAARPRSRGSPPAPRSPTCPAQHAANHFFDPPTGDGWERPSAIARSPTVASTASTLPEHGVPAPDWVIDKDNPFNLAGFLDQYAKAVDRGDAGRALARTWRRADRGRRDDARARRSRRAVARARRRRGAPRSARRRSRRSRLAVRAHRGARLRPARRARRRRAWSRARTCATTSRRTTAAGSPT